MPPSVHYAPYVITFEVDRNCSHKLIVIKALEFIKRAVKAERGTMLSVGSCMRNKGNWLRQVRMKNAENEELRIPTNVCKKKLREQEYQKYFSLFIKINLKNRTIFYRYLFYFSKFLRKTLLYKKKPLLITRMMSIEPPHKKII